MTEAPRRYCGNCGNELSDDDQFCRSCGTPVHQAATVPTPEAEVDVPPPPQPGGAGGAAVPQQPAQQGFGRRHPILLGCLGVFGLLVVLIIIGAALGGGGDETAGGGGGGGGQQDQAQNQGQGQNQAQGQNQGQDQGQGQKKQAPARIGETVVVGDAAYTVTRAWRETVLRDPSGFDDPMQGNFVLVDFTVENRGDEPMSVSDIGLYVYDDQDRQYETETDIPLGAIPENKDLFLLDRINPGLSQDVRVVFSVPPDAKSFEMEVSSGFFSTETRRISLGF
jgi:hypothetical protein